MSTERPKVVVMQSIELPQRYWAKVDKRGECWLWVGARNDSGYGVIGARSITGRSHEYAHRLMFWHEGGELAPGEVVDHTCGKGHAGCVTPGHLRALSMRNNSSTAAPDTQCRHCGGPRWQQPSGKWVCKPCRAKYHADYTAKNRDHINQQRRLRRAP